MVAARRSPQYAPPAPPKRSGPLAPGWWRTQALIAQLPLMKLLATSRLGWLGGAEGPQRLMSPTTVDDKSSRPMRRSSASFGPTSFGYPFSRRTRSTTGHAPCSADDTHVLASLLHELLKPAPGTLRFFNHPRNLCSGLVHGQLETYEVKD